ncbi:class I SAM-dependent methyltransferase [Ornithinibacillus californiensis]|uniref:class I SAM-dependent methyltransferase n=1 Tax=Ornithinibacillus californiensis TaxID=161536 RepID=UPI000A75C53E|nr:class I SAM-dependent methyltransferase [Ornithinibacillus californiensis]
METKEILKVNKDGWENAAERFFGRTALPELGPLAPTEEDLNLFGDVRDKKVLDIGCGSGHSLQYMGNRGASELWGLDLTTKQIETASQLLEAQSVPVNLYESPMEENPGLPQEYFDIAYSIYALGWTVDLERTLANICSYLKPGGTFVFSWEHPMHDRVKREGSSFIVEKSYLEEGPEYNEAWNHEVIIYHRKLTTYINTLIKVGLVIDRVIDDVVLPDIVPEGNHRRWYSVDKAKLIPATFIIKASKRE